MTVNLHTHTYRCGHASGTEREYIEKAISAGITHMGFSEHIPFPLTFPDGHISAFRLPMEQSRDYIEELCALRKEYRDRITIYIGFEMEYYPRYYKEMLSYACDLGAEYLLLGQHYIDNEDFYKNSVFKPCSEESRLASYVDTVIEAMETGVFTYVAHPDVINFQGDPAIYQEQMRRICVASTGLDLPLEINFLGIRDDRHYPRLPFWQIAGEEGCSVVFGFDAHDAAGAGDTQSLPIAKKIVDAYGLKVVPYPTLVHPQTGERTTILPREKKKSTQSS